MAVNPIHHQPQVAHAHHKASPQPTLLTTIQQDYQKGRMDKGTQYKLIQDPDTDPTLKRTSALKKYRATMGEGPDLNDCTDGDHMVYRRKTGELVVETFPEDSTRGDQVWVYDKTGQKLLGHAVSVGDRFKWDAEKK